MAKKNPFLASFEAKIRQEMAEEFARQLAEFDAQKEAEFDLRLAKNTEFNMLAMLINGSDLGIIGEKRAAALLEGHLDAHLRIADAIIADAENDPDLVYTIHDLASRVKSILGAEGWKRYQTLFPMLRDYWNKEENHD